MKKLIILFVTFILLMSVFSLSSCHKKANGTVNLMDSIDYQKKSPDWVKGSNIYEVNVRQYTPEGTFKAFQQHLPRLKAMGVDILWLMPINPIGEKNRKGSLGSYYSIKDYTAINPEFGTENDFKALVSEVHKLGMHIIIDWVANHTSWDNVWMSEHKDWYTQDSLGNVILPAGTDWDDTADLNYDNADMRRAMIDAMAYWVKTADIDGFRCDVAGMVPLIFWIHARKAIDEIKPDCFFLAEDSDPEYHKAFDMTYNWPLKDLMNNIAKGNKNAADLVTFFEGESKQFKDGDIRMQFTTNHDENTWSGTEYERLGDKAVDAFTVLTYTIPGMPLTYTGQEEPLLKRLRFFEKDTVEFKNYSRNNLILKLNELKKRNSALWSTNYSSGFLGVKNSNPTNVLSFVRHKKRIQVLCVFNFSAVEQSFEILDLFPGEFNYYMGDKISAQTNVINKLAPWGYSIYIAMK